MKGRETGRRSVSSWKWKVVTVALKQGLSASDDLMEWLFNPTLIHKSADMCAVRQMCVWKQLRLRRWRSARESVSQCTPPVRIVTLRLSSRRKKILICVAATDLPELVFFIVLKTTAGDISRGKFLWLSPCLRRRWIPPWRPRRPRWPLFSMVFCERWNLCWSATLPWCAILSLPAWATRVRVMECEHAVQLCTCCICVCTVHTPVGCSEVFLQAS